MRERDDWIGKMIFPMSAKIPRQLGSWPFPIVSRQEDLNKAQWRGF